MKITINQLKRIIKEELQTTLSEKQYDIIQPGEPGYNEVYQKAYDQMMQAEAMVREAANVFKEIKKQFGSYQGIERHARNPYAMTDISEEAVESILIAFESYNDG